MAIDLHTHSTASDGSFEPAALAARAADLRIEAVALTDHDTVAGLDAFMAAGAQYGVETVPGCELSVSFGTYKMHILGLWTPPRPEKLVAAMDELIRHRHERNFIIVDKLRALGCDISYEEVREVAGEGSVGRPHIATVLLRRKCVKSLQEAFDVYLGGRGKAYAPKKVLEADAAFALLKECGATVLMAHPFQNGFGMGELENVVRQLMELGLDGLEAYYSEHSPSQTANCLALADKLDLAVSGGSDFHGAPKARISLARGRGDLDIPYAVLERLKERRAKQGLSSAAWPS